MQATNKIIFNTIVLYLRQFISIIIGLYSTRLILNGLGTQDFGLFSLIGSVISMLAFLNGAMSFSSQRFLSFALGSGNLAELAHTFKTAKYLHLIIGCIILIALEILGPLLFNSYLNIPVDRIEASKFVFHCVVFSTFFTIISVPYDGLINAHENMVLVAIITTVEVFLRLGMAISLYYIEFDKLMFLGALTAGITVASLITKRVYCSISYKEASYSESQFQRERFREMLVFALFNTFSTLSGIAKNSGIAVILNMFFTSMINAAYGIANQVNGQIMNFSNMLMKAITPQIVKSEGAKNRERAQNLSISACKISFLLICLFAFPMVINAPFVLKIWLGTIPDHAIRFTQLILILSMVGQITLPLFHYIQAIGYIQAYQTSLGSLQLLNLPIVYILCKLDLPAYYAILSTISIEAVAGTLRIFFAKKYGNLHVLKFMTESVLPATAITVLAFFIVFSPFLQNHSWLGLIVSSSLSTLTLIIFAWFLFFNDSERSLSKNIIGKISKKLPCQIKKNQPSD